MLDLDDDEELTDEEMEELVNLPEDVSIVSMGIDRQSDRQTDRYTNR